MLGLNLSHVSKKGVDKLTNEGERVLLVYMRQWNGSPLTAEPLMTPRKKIRWIKMHFFVNKMHLKMSTVLSQPQCVINSEPVMSKELSRGMISSILPHVSNNICLMGVANVNYHRWFPSQRASNAELRWFLCCLHEQAFEQEVDDR